MVLGTSRRLILKSFQSPGDVLMLTVAIRDLHVASAGQFQTDVRTSADALFENNPHITRLSEGDSGVESLDMHYPLIHQSNQRPYHFIHGYAQYLEEKLGLRIPLTRFAGDIHLSKAEKQLPPPGKELGIPEHFWIIIGGGKNDFTAKWWNPASYQAVVDHFRGRIQFVQCGEAGHWHPPLTNVINLLGKTNTREFVRLMYHADGVVCPVTFAMHLAAAVETKPGRPRVRPCVVIAGGREPKHWEAYPQHQFLDTIGMLPCCAEGGCWKSRCQLVGDGDPKDQHDVCVSPVQIRPDLRIAKCMEMITPEDVIRRIEMYLASGMHRLSTDRNGEGEVVATTPHTVQNPMPNSTPDKPAQVAAANQTYRVRFHHGLGDCAYFAHMIPLYTRRGYRIEVECTPDKRIMFEAAGAVVLDSGADHIHDWGYPSGATHAGHGNFWQGSKIGHNISEAPLPNIGGKGELWDELCASRIDILPHLSAEARATARCWLEQLPRPVVLFHQKGNTAQDRKSLPDNVTVEFYKTFIDHCDGTLVLLDWDQRVPRLATYRVRHLTDLGPCSLDLLLAMMTDADLLIGVDSGPLHLARFTNIPTIGLWRSGHYPTTYTLPRPEQLNVVLAEHTRQWNKFKRIPWNLYEHPGGEFDARILADVTQRMLSEPRYLRNREANAQSRSLPTIAQDVQLQQFIQEYCRCRGSSSLAHFWDRNRSFDHLFREISRRFDSPTIVETGTIRSEEDFGGAGFFTYVAGTFLSRQGGRLHSVDLSPQNVAFAREWTAIFGDVVTIHQGDSVAFLTNFAQPIDVLYLDSLDTTEPGHADHAMRELEVALPKLHERSLIVLDDTPWQAGVFSGKGARVVPWLLEHGWQVFYAGYQVLLTRSLVPYLLMAETPHVA